jgi:hypothetical protein
MFRIINLHFGSFKYPVDSRFLIGGQGQTSRRPGYVQLCTWAVFEGRSSSKVVREEGANEGPAQ